MFPASYHEMEPGKYQLSSSGNVFASIETLKGKIDKRAAELCGQDNYVYSDDGDFSTPHSPAYMNGVDIGASYKVLNRKIECKKS
jgi:hypothetical protein